MILPSGWTMCTHVFFTDRTSKLCASRNCMMMMRNRHDVVGFENARLPQNLLSHLTQRQPVARRVKVFQSSRRLNRLKRHAAHAALLEREIDHLADLVIVQPFLERHDKRR